MFWRQTGYIICKIASMANFVAGSAGAETPTGCKRAFRILPQRNHAGAIHLETAGFMGHIQRGPRESSVESSVMAGPLQAACSEPV